MNAGRAAIDATAGAVSDCVDNSNTRAHGRRMSQPSTTAQVNIHLRARERDRAIIDQAAELIGANRSQFMLASALKEAKNVLLDQTTIHADAKAFQEVMEWMDSAATPAEAAGMKRIVGAKPPWRSD